MTLPDPVALAIPAFIVLIVLEIGLFRFGLRKGRYELQDTAASLAMGPRQPGVRHPLRPPDLCHDGSGTSFCIV